MDIFLNSNRSFYPCLPDERPSTTAKTHRFRMSSTGDTFVPNNTISNFLPQTSARSSSSSSFRNTKGKLQSLSDQLTDLLQAVKQARLGSKEIQLHLHFAREELTSRGIDPMRVALMHEIKMLEKAVQIKKRSDLLRFQALHETCNALGRNSKEIKGRMNEVGERLRQVQGLLGYHELRNKLKY